MSARLPQSRIALVGRALLLITMVVGVGQLLQLPATQDIRFDRYGDGSPVTIAVHGSPGTRGDFSLLAPLIDGTVYALDMPGFGGSRMGARDYGVDAAAEVVLAFMNRQSIDRARVLGYSWGGAVAVEAAIAAPERISQIVLLDSMGIPEAEPIPVYPLERLRYWISAPFLLAYPGSLVLDLRTRHGFLRSYLDTDLNEVAYHLRSLQTPTLIVHGRHDTVVEPWAAERMHELVPHSELRWFDGGHGTIFYDGRVIAEALQ
ncbi:MAG: alpha/beta fold hydrolase [Pseudomonadota bacterium]